MFCVHSEWLLWQRKNKLLSHVSLSQPCTTAKIGWGVSHHLFTQGPPYMYTSTNVIHPVSSSQAVPLFPAVQEHDFTAKCHIQVTPVCGNTGCAQERRTVTGHTRAASEQWCLPPLLAKCCGGKELLKWFNSKLKHRRGRIEQKEAFLSLVPKQDWSSCLALPFLPVTVP